LCLTAVGVGLARSGPFAMPSDSGRDAGERHAPSALPRHILRDRITGALAVAAALLVQVAAAR